MVCRRAYNLLGHREDRECGKADKEKEGRIQKGEGFKIYKGARKDTESSKAYDLLRYEEG